MINVHNVNVIVWDDHRRGLAFGEQDLLGMSNSDCFAVDMNVKRHEGHVIQRVFKDNTTHTKVTVFHHLRDVNIHRAIRTSLSPRGTSGERAGERGSEENEPPLPVPLLPLRRRRGRREFASISFRIKFADSCVRVFRKLDDAWYNLLVPSKN